MFIKLNYRKPPEAYWLCFGLSNVYFMVQNDIREKVFGKGIWDILY